MDDKDDIADGGNDGIPEAAGKGVIDSSRNLAVGSDVRLEEQLKVDSRLCLYRLFIAVLVGSCSERS